MRIKNFLSYKDARFTDLKNYNVLIGKNNAGKSNFIKILGFLNDYVKTSRFNNKYLYDESSDIDAKISLTFKLSSQLRNNIFEILYDRGYLKSAFISLEGKEEYISKWNKKEIALGWLCSQGFYNFIEISLEYHKEHNSIIIRKINAIHNDIEEPQILYEGREKENRNDAYIHGYTENSQTFESFLTSFNPNLAHDLLHISIYNLIRKDPKTINSLKTFNPILEIIIYEILKKFLFSINIIPYDRQFEASYDRIDLVNTKLDLDGGNFVKFVDKLLSTDKKEWVDDINKELKTFFTDINELTKTIDDKDQSILILKEHGLLSRLRKENMGAGILNIAFFLTWIKILKKNKILCIEEPELYIYPGLQKKILDKFLDVSEDIQIFVTTHSKYFLSTNDNVCSVYLIHKINNKSITYKVPKEDFPEIYKNMEIVLDEYEKDQLIFYNDIFWENFIKKAMNREEDQLWDFKQYYEMWKAPNSTVKEKKKIEFCEEIAAFANAEGGVIIIGITDKIPRKIVGLEKIEEKKNSIPSILNKFTNLKLTTYIMRDILIKAENNEERRLLAIIIPQTKKVSHVKGLDQKFSYPIRIGSRLNKVDYNTILELKKNINQPNFKFIHRLYEFSKK